MYKVFLSREAEKQLKKLDKRYQKAVISGLFRLGENPNLGEPLKYELKGKYRLRVGSYRIVYRLEHFQKLINVLQIEHRKDVYR